ncbi:MAG TPA: (Fe-S)-binding protein [Gaiellaceae bacterium]|nr:(Fe-S)-binding protein [Gaiellaceae bacterium]
MRVALFVTCIGDAVIPEVGTATVQVLERLGHKVVFPNGQTCCGQLHANSGYRQEATVLARRFVRVFSGFETIVAPSSSCVGMVREVYPVLARESGDEKLERDVRALVPRVFELSELIVNRLEVTDVGASFPHRVTYHPTCHSLRVTRVGDAPLRLLEAVDGLDLVELPDAAECCGFGGTFAVKNADTSSAMVIDKCSAIVSTRATVCTALDGSCLLQIGGRLSREHAGVRTLHLAEILAATGTR